MNPRPLWVVCILAATLGWRLAAAPENNGVGSRGTRGPGPQGGPVGDFKTTVPAHALDAILGRPTRTSVVLRVLSYQDVDASVAWGAEEGKAAQTSPVTSLRSGEPTDFVLGGLAPDTQGFYELRAGHERLAGSFHTARPPGKPFTFTITADPHLDEHTEPDIYLRTLANAATDRPDFHIDLGDTFMTGKHASRETAASQYLAQRYYFGQLCRSAPLFLVLGNHDGEGQRELSPGGDGLGLWATGMRTRYFPNPVPDGYFTGNTQAEASTGRPQNYYAWEWGDALFIVLDPFRYSGKPVRGQDTDAWHFTLGREQYDWLQSTLEGSISRYKFVFTHHLVGGVDRQGRGGSEAVPYFEWGGRNRDGTAGFAEKRPGWPLPIHALLLKHGVRAVFHGHDHFFARQEADGIVYQLVPQPGHSGEGSIRQAKSYGYERGEFRPGSGHLRVIVSTTRISVEYVRTPDEPGPVRDAPATVDFTYEIRSEIPDPQDNP